MRREQSGQQETILVVDDNPQNRVVIENYLSADGYQVIQAANGQEAVDIFGARPVDLVLLDVKMPVMDGFEACRRIRAMERGTEVPILFITGMGDFRTHEMALQSGADDFLAKPIQRVELLLRAKSLLRIKRLETDLGRSNQFISSQRDALLHAHLEKRRLTAMIVHDLRGPLACILGNADFVLADTCLTEGCREALSDIRSTADVMDRMINDLLDVARSEDGALHLRFEPVDLRDLLEDIRCCLRGQGRGSENRIVIDGASTAGSVEADKGLLRRIVENLVGNSMKYAPPGSEIRIEVLAAEGGNIKLRVCDHGPGVPVEYRTKIFDQYVHCESGTQDPLRRSRGLGLAFCKLAVEAHGGDIWIEDSPPVGSAFCFWIPKTRPRPEVAQQDNSRVEETVQGVMTGCTGLPLLATS
jgi:signal transduction histidine kinase